MTLLNLILEYLHENNIRAELYAPKHDWQTFTPYIRCHRGDLSFVLGLSESGIVSMGVSGIRIQNVRTVISHYDIADPSSFDKIVRRVYTDRTGRNTTA